MKEYVDIPGFEGMYQINREGQVMGLRGRYGKQPKILSIKNGTAGYKEVSLCHRKGRKTICLHRLLAQTFLPNPESKPQVNHIDADKHNNSLDNLEWVTRSENQQHAANLGLLKGNRTLRKLSKEDVANIRAMKGIKQKDIAKMYNVVPSAICQILKNKLHKCVYQS